jgi:hypothetical protein
MATAKKATKKASKPAAEEDDDLLAGKGDKKGAKAKKGTKAKASAEDVDDILEGKKGSKAAAKGNGKAKPAAKKPAGGKRKQSARAEDIADTDEVRKALLKYKRATSYADIQTATGFNIRQIRRTARSMRDNGELTLTKDGTTVLVARA